MREIMLFYCQNCTGNSCIICVLWKFAPHIANHDCKFGWKETWMNRFGTYFRIGGKPSFIEQSDTVSRTKDTKQTVVC